MICLSGAQNTEQLLQDCIGPLRGAFLPVVVYRAVLPRSSGTLQYSGKTYVPVCYVYIHDPSTQVMWRADGPERDMALQTVRTVAEKIPELDPGSRSRLAPVIVHFSVPLFQGLCSALQQSSPEQQAHVIETLHSWLHAIPWDCREPLVPLSAPFPHLCRY